MSERGFTLLELVIALGILAGGTVLAQQAIGRAALGLHGADARDVATLVAEARIAELRARPVLAASEAEATDPDGSRWLRRVSLDRRVPGTRLALWRVTVSVTPTRGPPITLDTLMVAGTAR